MTLFSELQRTLAADGELEFVYEVVDAAEGREVHSCVQRDDVLLYDAWNPADEIATEVLWLSVAINGGLF